MNNSNYIEPKDKNILKNVGITIIDSLVSSLDNSLYSGQPYLSTPWGLCKGLYNSAIELRKDRAIEFIENIRDNPSIFTKQIVSSKEFQDGFIYTFTKYLVERTEQKRKIIKKIFLNFTASENKNDFKLERYLYTLEQISIDDINIIKTFCDGTIQNWIKSQFPNKTKEELDKEAKDFFNVAQIGQLILYDIKGFSKFKDDEYAFESLTKLSNLSLLISSVSTGFNFQSFTSFKMSKFGEEFVEFIKN